MEHPTLDDPGEEAAFDTWLRQELQRQAPRADARFTRRVLAHLPLPPPTAAASLRTPLCLAGALIGGGVAALGAATADVGPLNLPDPVSGSLALGIAALSLLAALRPQLRRTWRHLAHFA